VSSYTPSEEVPLQTLNAFIIFQGEIGSWDMDEVEININITTEMRRWNQRTLYAHPANCRWKVFGGAQCQYSGNAIISDGVTDGSTGVITGLADTSAFSVGDYIIISNGFSARGPYYITALSSTTITVNGDSNTIQTGVQLSKQCDRSYASCTAYANTDNFGGFRFLPYLENKEVLWGPK